MTRVLGPSLDQLDALADDYAGLIATALADAAQRPEAQAAEDLAPLRTVWTEWVDGTLLPALGVGYEVGAATIRVGLREAAGLSAEEESDGERADSAQPGGD